MLMGDKVSISALPDIIGWNDVRAGLPSASFPSHSPCSKAIFLKADCAALGAFCENRVVESNNTMTSQRDMQCLQCSVEASSKRRGSFAQSARLIDARRGSMA